MAELHTGSDAPDFCLPDSDGNEVCLENFRGSWVILYFYPKDNTSGCTLEAIDFTARVDALKQMNTAVLGVSPDSQSSHCRFRDKHELKVTLLSDEDHGIIEKYGAWALKKNYGREYYGVQRSTCIIDPEGKVAHVWPKVKVKGHVDEVCEKLQHLQEK